MENTLSVFVGCLLPSLYAAYTDIKKGVIYDYITLLIFIAGLIYAVVTKFYISALLGFSLGFISFFIVAWITNGALGGGDIKLAAGIGIWFGYPDVVFILIFAALVAILFELIRYWRSGRLKELFLKRLYPYGRKVFIRFGCLKKDIYLSISREYTPIPFGPFLVASSWLMWVLGLLVT